MPSVKSEIEKYPDSLFLKLPSRRCCIDEQYFPPYWSWRGEFIPSINKAPPMDPRGTTITRGICWELLCRELLLWDTADDRVKKCDRRLYCRNKYANSDQANEMCHFKWMWKTITCLLEQSVQDGTCRWRQRPRKGWADRLISIKRKENNGQSVLDPRDDMWQYEEVIPILVVNLIDQVTSSCLYL